MGLESLLSRLENRSDATHDVTPNLDIGVTRKPLIVNDLTPVTPVTPTTEIKAANDAGNAEKQHLPIQSSFAMFESLFARLAALASYPVDFCAEVLEKVRASLTPENAQAEIDVVRELIAEWELTAIPAPADDRITCRDCANRRTYDGVCEVAEVGGMVNAMRGYVPDATLPLRCAGFLPKATAEDKRIGAERWPNLGIGES